ncbi:hypothetical protein RN001_011043 [Aquatica leii]|uniref:Uncharacterized protein n=1 Tax=Aquatica leii TaxID=1421715 RepID=A0AAN7SEU3_9COLE|nr:hypothetical protein RN001_011043 [Aquatica leii]
MCDSTNTCRICLFEITETKEFYFLNNDNELKLQSKLLEFLPEIDLNITPNPIISCPIQRNNREQNRQYNKYGYDQNKYGHSSRQLTRGRGKFENGNADRVAPIQNRRKEIQCDNLLTEEEAEQEEEFVEELQINQIKEEQKITKGWYKEIQIKIYDDYDLTNVNNNPPVTNNENANNSSCSESSRPKRNVKQPAYLSDYI